MTVWDDLGVSLPVLAAPMAGGPTTSELVRAVAAEGGLGFLAGGYRTADGLAEQLDAVGDGTWGVNLFVPNPVPIDQAAFARYRAQLAPPADDLGVTLPEGPIEDDDHWRDKIDLLLGRPAPVVSFTFGIPEPAVLSELRRVGSVLAQTVTSPAEAGLAVDAGVDVLIVQASAAGGHSGTLTPTRRALELPLTDLLDAVRADTDLPLVATGGVVDADGVADALAHGAQAVAIGTALLLAPESGTSEVHRHAPAAGPRRHRRHPRLHRTSGAGAAQRLRPPVRRHRTTGLPGRPSPHRTTAPRGRRGRRRGERPSLGRHRVSTCGRPPGRRDRPTARRSCVTVAPTSCDSLNHPGR